ncbi:hypothetical protein MYAM1_000086 [Malassezia yamatoensis]|uniref:Uncharacterized protein n=1 Tax=Malassezia yamatoensis TaxID=253288 RepID=A0AAJ6CH27_9BASI|nr:hypothetical protein MYAM1_000086 [Malassezia yamatoensis]
MATAVPTVVEPNSEPSTIRARDMSSVNPDESGDISLSSPESKRGHHRRRSSSFVVVKHVRETPDQLVDQIIAPNANADWVNMKGAWVIHVLLIAVAKLIINEVPGISDSVRWTLVNVGYMTVSFIMFHSVQGTHFEFDSGAYDNLTLWEQIDHGYQYTPSKKYLTSLPIGLFIARKVLVAISASAPPSSILQNPTKRTSNSEMTAATRFATSTTQRHDWMDNLRRWKLVPASSRSLRLSPSSWMPTRRRSSRGDTSIDDSDEDCTPMDPEELAALNAIINTRRSMATAHALAQKPVQCLSSNNPKEFLRTYSLPATLDNSASQSGCSTSEEKLCSETARCIRFAPFPPSIFEDSLQQEENESCLSEDEDSLNDVPVEPRSTRPLRRLSTGALGLCSSMERHRLSIDDEDPGRSQRSWRRSRNRSPARSQSPAPRSSEEKMRRRELIRAIRPGGTGMVTLLDGERIEARKVGDPNHEKLVDQNIQDQLWGFAALERSRKVSSNPAEIPQNPIDQDSIPIDQNRRASQLSRSVSMPKLCDESGSECGGSCSATDSDEIQRRYETEVLALSAEVLNHVRKDRLLARRNSVSEVSLGQRTSSASSRPAPSTASHKPSSSNSSLQRTHSKVIDRGGCHYLTVPDPSISMPLPLDTLPRRPDAIGIRVVPLSHLGRRPERPREGCVWASWELSDSDSDLEDEAPPMRATTRAAGQEVIHCRNTVRRFTESWSVPFDAKHAIQATNSIPSFTNEMDEFWPAPSATRSIVAPRNAANFYRGLEKKTTRL